MLDGVLMSTNEPPGHPNTSCVQLGADCAAHDRPMLCPHRCDATRAEPCECEDKTDREIARSKR